jgi:hypothetical protein
MREMSTRENVLLELWRYNELNERETIYYAHTVQISRQKHARSHASLLKVLCQVIKKCQKGCLNA